MRPEQPKRATSADVAEMAGVSRATVSYVLNDRTDQRVSPETRARVLGIAEQLGFVPNAAALALKTGHTNVVLFDMPYWPLGAPTVEGSAVVFGVLEDLGYTPLVHFERNPDGVRLAEACRRLQPVGLIASGRFLTKKRHDMMRANGVRGMVALHNRRLSHVHTWVFEQSRVGEAALNHLAERGHQRVLAIMPLKGDEARYRDDRVRGATISARRHGIELEVMRTELDPQSMTQAVTDGLRGRRAPTAIYAFNDEYARAAQGALHDLGLRIPDDVALLGSDDGPLATFGWPRLSSIAVSSPERWAALARALHEVVEGLPVSDSGAMPPLYVVRRDTT